MAAWMAAAGIGQLHLQGPDLSLTLTGPMASGRVPQARHPVVPSTASSEETHVEAAGHVVKAPCAGYFLPAHPLRDTPCVALGSEVAIGQVLGLMRVGALLVPVRSAKPGLLHRVLAEADTLLGFGSPLFDIQTKA